MKNMKRVYSLALVVLMLMSFTACQVYSGDKTTTTTTNASGEITPDVTVNGDNGNAIKVEGTTAPNDTGSVQNGETTRKNDNTTTKNGVTTTQKEGTPSTTKNSGNSGITINKTTTTQKQSDNTTTTTAKPTTSYYQQLKKNVFAKGVYTIDAKMYTNTSEGKLSAAFKFAQNGRKNYMSMEYTLGGFSVGVILNNTKAYMILHPMKIYQEVEDVDVGFDEMSGILDTEARHVGTKKVKISDTIYICEEIVDSSGASTFYYFTQDGTLARIKTSDSQGEFVMLVNKVTTSVNEADFKVPKGYKKANVKDYVTEG